MGKKKTSNNNAKGSRTSGTKNSLSQKTVKFEEKIESIDLTVDGGGCVGIPDHGDDAAAAAVVVEENLGSSSQQVVAEVDVIEDHNGGSVSNIESGVTDDEEVGGIGKNVTTSTSIDASPSAEELMSIDETSFIGNLSIDNMDDQDCDGNADVEIKQAQAAAPSHCEAIDTPNHHLPDRTECEPTSAAGVENNVLELKISDGEEFLAESIGGESLFAVEGGVTKDNLGESRRDGSIASVAATLDCRRRSSGGEGEGPIFKPSNELISDYTTKLECQSGRTNNGGEDSNGITEGQSIAGVATNNLDCQGESTEPAQPPRSVTLDSTEGEWVVVDDEGGSNEIRVSTSEEVAASSIKIEGGKMSDNNRGERWMSKLIRKIVARSCCNTRVMMYDTTTPRM